MLSLGTAAGCTSTCVEGWLVAPLVFKVSFASLEPSAGKSTRQPTCLQEIWFARSWITDCLAPRPWHLCSSTSEWSCACFSKTRRGSICSLTLFATVSATFCHRPKQGILVCLHSSSMGVKSAGLTPLRGNMVTSSNQVVQVKGQLEWRFWKVGLCPSLLLHASVGVEMHQHVASHCASPIWLTFSVRIPSKKQLSSLMTDPSRGLRCKFACNCTKAYHIGSRSQVWANGLSQKLSSTYSCLFWCIWVVPKQLREASA